MLVTQCILSGTSRIELSVYIGPDKTDLLSLKLRIFSYPSVLTFVCDAQKNHLIETVLLSTHNICVG